MYHLLSGLYEHLTRKEEFGVLILGLDGAGKTVRASTVPSEGTSSCIQTLLEAIKSQYNHTSPLPPSKIAPTVGQNSEPVDCGVGPAEIDRLASYSRKDHTTFYYIEVLGSRLALIHPL
jgi:hypothetical protein